MGSVSIYNLVRVSLVSMKSNSERKTCKQNSYMTSQKFPYHYPITEHICFVTVRFVFNHLDLRSILSKWVRWEIKQRVMDFIPPEPSIDMSLFQLSSPLIQSVLWQLQNQQPWQSAQKINSNFRTPERERERESLLLLHE